MARPITIPILRDLSSKMYELCFLNFLTSEVEVNVKVEVKIFHGPLKYKYNIFSETSKCEQDLRVYHS